MGRNPYVKRRCIKRKTNDANDIVLAEALDLPKVINQSTCWKAYHLEESHCCLHVPPNPKVKNCRNNPFCIHRLGLDKIEKLKNQQTDNAASDLARREIDKQPCGLVNFGNFCYVNSFLQIWYNDLVFRQCIYDWRPDPNFIQPDGAKMNVQEVMNCMQELFLTMQFTPFETTNALELIRLLKLDNEQHDVQEFNTLFFDALDRNLAYHPNGAKVRQVIQSRFESRIRQIIKCNFCGSNSVTESEYRSLQISIEGHNSLLSAVKAFFSPESLSDYKCDGCGKNDSVTRFSQFSKLPPILLLQFNRYVFDSNGRHKKLKTAIQYPRSFSEKFLQNDTNGNSTYNLTAVMIHEGPNTHCGHYYDLIKNPVDGQWFTYNDKNVALTKSPGVNVEKQSIQRATTDMKECYALIYQRSGTNYDISIDSLRLPPLETVSEIQKNLNEKFLKESKEGNVSLNLWKNQVEKRYKFLQDLWNDLEVKNGKNIRRNELAFLPTALLIEILTKEFKSIEEMKALEQFTPCNNIEIESENGYNNVLTKESKQNLRLSIENDMYYMEPLEETKMALCPHEQIPLNSVLKGEVKGVQKSAADFLLKYYNIELTAYTESNDNVSNENVIQLKNNTLACLKTGEDICVECVKILKKDATFKKTLDATNELPVMKVMRQRTHNPRIQNPGVEYPAPKTAYWVSEKHLRCFKKLALEQMEYSKNLNQIVRYLVFSVDDNFFYRSKSENSTKTENKSDDFSLNFNGNGTLKDCDLNNQNYKQKRKRKLDYNNLNELNLKEDNDAQDCKLLNNYSKLDSNSFDSEISSDQFNETNGFEMDTEKPGTSRDSSNESIKTEISKKPAKFNEDLFCAHGNLTYMVRRTWVTAQEWDIIKENFLEYCDPFPCTAEECPQCIQNYIKNINDLKSCQDLLGDILSKIGKTIRLIERRKKWEIQDLGTIYTHIICNNFIQKITKCMKSKSNAEIPFICQECLLCKHNMPFLILNDQENKVPAGTPITTEEWQLLSNVYKTLTNHDQPFEITITENKSYTKFCSKCSNEFLENEDNKRFIYPFGGWIYKGDEIEEKDRKILSSMVTTRRLAAKNLLKFKLLSSDRIIDLKMRIYEQIKQSPSDQLLYLNDNALENEQTLKSARVEANNIHNPIILIVQQCIEMSPSGETRQLEKGFKDTALSI